jgi:hypothetical protein
MNNICYQRRFGDGQMGLGQGPMGDDRIIKVN